jgi:hypothetical protein
LQGVVICDEFRWSAELAWLPAEFAADAEGRVRIESYVNNLHPQQHAALYPLLERAFECVLPLLERVVTQLDSETETDSGVIQSVHFKSGGTGADERGNSGSAGMM